MWLWNELLGAWIGAKLLLGGRGKAGGWRGRDWFTFGFHWGALLRGMRGIKPTGSGLGIWTGGAKEIKGGGICSLENPSDICFSGNSFL